MIEPKHQFDRGVFKKVKTSDGDTVSNVSSSGFLMNSV